MRSRDLAGVGRAYRLARNGFLPDRIHRSGRRQRRKAREALGDGTGWLARLAMAGPNLQFFTLALEDLGLKHLCAESNLYDHAAVNAIKEAVHSVFEGAFWASLEVGSEARKLHVHALAHTSPTVAHAARDVGDLQGIALYVCKNPTPNDDLAAGIFLEAKSEARAKGVKRLPNTTFRRGIPNS